MARRLIIISRHLPFSIGQEEEISLAGDHVTMPVASYIKNSKDNFTEIFWAGESFCSRTSWPAFSRSIDKTFTCIPVFIPHATNEILHDNSTLNEPEQLNKLLSYFAEAIVINLRPTDTVWIQGHELATLAPILRNQCPELTIGLSIHIPFPSFDSFRLLPGKRQHEFLTGIMSADLVSFKKTEHVTNYLQCLLMVLGLDNERKVVHYNNRLVMADTFEDTEPSGKWTFDFMHALQAIKERQNGFRIKFLDEYTRRNLYDAYRMSKNRLILLDYDGTLVSFSSRPEMAVPGEELLQLIQRLSSAASNDVFLVSGRNSAFLEEHFGTLPVNLIAEHGASHKWKDREWVKEVDTNNEWKKDAKKIMDAYVEKCENSFVEEKEFSIAWHYRNAPQEEGKLRAFELASELKVFVENRHLQVMMGKKIVELRQSGISKGSFVRKVVEEKEYDYIFAAGDDRTDEDMFKALLDKNNAFTIKVGAEASYAEYNLHTPQMVLSLLQGFDHLSSSTPA